MPSLKEFEAAGKLWLQNMGFSKPAGAPADAPIESGSPVGPPSGRWINDNGQVERRNGFGGNSPMGNGPSHGMVNGQLVLRGDKSKESGFLDKGTEGGDTWKKTPEQWAAQFPAKRNEEPVVADDEETPPEVKLFRKGTGGGTRQGQADAPKSKRPEVDLSQDEEAAKFKALIDEYEKKPTQVNLKPLFALADAWTGHNTAASYDAPMSQEQKDKTVFGMREKQYQKESEWAVRKQQMIQQGFTADQIAAEKAREFADTSARGWEGLRIQKDKAAAAKAGKAGDAEKTYRERASFLQGKYGKRIDSISQARWGKRDEDGKFDPNDKTFKNRNDEVIHDILTYADLAEEMGYAKKGEGLAVSLAKFGDNPMGTDGASAGR